MKRAEPRENQEGRAPGESRGPCPGSQEGRAPGVRDTSLPCESLFSSWRLCCSLLETFLVDRRKIARKEVHNREDARKDFATSQPRTLAMDQPNERNNGLGQYEYVNRRDLDEKYSTGHLSIFFCINPFPHNEAQNVRKLSHREK